jgi:hypothetical protein
MRRGGRVRPSLAGRGPFDAPEQWPRAPRQSRFAVEAHDDAGVRSVDRVRPADPHSPLSSPEIRGHTPSSVRLFGPEAIALHTVLLTPLVGSVLAAINHRRLGNGGAARRAVLAFAVPSAALLVAELVESDGLLSAVLRLAGFAWTIAVARRLFLEHQVLFARHVASGGQAERWYLATLAVVGVIVIALTTVFASELLGPR